MKVNNLSESQKERYLRNILMPEIGEEGQLKLLNAKILVIGAGGLGSPLIYYLSAAGVGKLGIVDNDKVELSNLQRQIIHNFSDLNVAKVQSAATKISKLNSDVEIEQYQIRANEENLTKIVDEYDIVVDATDNFEARFVINKICHQYKKPFVHAAVRGFLGQIAIFKSFIDNNPCYACFNPVSNINMKIEIEEKGILGAVAGVAGSIQANLIIKEIVQNNDDFLKKMLFFDLFKLKFREAKINKKPNCSICSK